MPIVYEVPTHLNVSDTIVFGLGAHQLVRLAAGMSLGFLVWDQVSALPAELRLTLAGLLVAAGLACALLQPGGRPLDRWVIAAALYLAMPRRHVWRRAPAISRVAERDRSGWADSSPELDWTDRSATDALTSRRSRT
jgi:hypothetical protein